VKGVSFGVARGEVVGLLGPNGAGKSSALLALVGLVRAEAGEVRLDGETLRPGDARLRARAGVVFQHAALDGRLTARENLRLAGALHGLGGADLRARVAEALIGADLGGRRNDLVRRLSGGMRRRVELAGALLHDPELLLLDEPTTGLDVASFRSAWAMLRARAAAGLAAVLTTHRADEAAGCDRLVVLHEGEVVADGKPEELRARVGGDILEVVVDDAETIARLLQRELNLRPETHGNRVRVVCEEGHELTPRVVEALPRGALRSLTVREPDLADAFLLLTGHGLAEAPGDERAGGGS
jgi:ABC-2 type transport system ATP-binding protein